MTNRLFTEDQLRNRCIDTLKRFLRIKLGGFRISISTIAAGNMLYRGVLHSQPPTTIDEVSYPPAERITVLGRVNRIGKPMFYCSLAGMGVLYELRAKVGDHFAISEWEVIEPLWMHNLGYHPDALRKLGASANDLSNRARHTHPFRDEPRAHFALRRKLSLAFTADVPIGQEYKYKQSIAMNELLFDKADPLPTTGTDTRWDRAAGTVYPAMRMRGVADNLAMLPEFVDSSLRIKSVRFVVVEAADEVSSAYTSLTLAFSNSFSGRHIVWGAKLAPEVQRRSHIALEGDRWVLRNGFNQIYDIH
jgi:hypothetical protein